MTRPEITGKRDIDFSRWIRKNLPDSSSGFLVSDIDFYIFNYKTKNHALVEIKTYTGQLKEWKRKMYERLGKWIKEGSEKEGWNFKGFFLIKKVVFEFRLSCFLNASSLIESIFSTLSCLDKAFLHCLVIRMFL